MAEQGAVAVSAYGAHRACHDAVVTSQSDVIANLVVIARPQAEAIPPAPRRRLGLASMLAQRRLRSICDTRFWVASSLRSSQ